MKLFKKRLQSKWYLFKIYFKNLYIKKSIETKSNLIEQIINNYSDKKRIVILCSGPSASKVKLSDDCLYLVTNSGYSLVVNKDFLYYVNDGFYIKKILASASSFLKRKQKIIFFYQNSKQHKEGFNFLQKNSNFLIDKELYYITNLQTERTFEKNYEEFEDFYQKRNLSIKIQNSGMFLLLFGYMLSVKMGLPLDLYGMDLGFGGENHFDKKGLVGKSVTSFRVKENVKTYLNYMKNEKIDFSNFSNFKPEFLSEK